MTDANRPVCDCPEPCGCYAEGYAAGKDKVYFEIEMARQGRHPRRRLRLSALPDQASRAGDDGAGQQLRDAWGP